MELCTFTVRYFCTLDMFGKNGGHHTSNDALLLDSLLDSLLARTVAADVTINRRIIKFAMVI